jgi:hypothetical protein
MVDNIDLESTADSIIGLFVSSERSPMKPRIRAHLEVLVKTVEARERAKRERLASLLTHYMELFRQWHQQEAEGIAQPTGLAWDEMADEIEDALAEAKQKGEKP